MLVTLKNLQHETFQVEADADNTVRQLKEKIEEVKGTSYAAEHQKLIYAGKILSDDSTLRAENIDEKKFIVCLVTKPKVTVASPSTPAPAPEATTQPSQARSEEPSASASAAPAAQQPPETEDSSQRSTTEAPGDLEAGIVTGAAYSEMINNIVAMGYTPEQVRQALAASFHNPERAVEYLINGIPDSVLADPYESRAAATASAAAGTVASADPPSGNQEEASGSSERAVNIESGDPLAFLRTQPQFQQMRQMIQRNPTLLHAILQQIGNTNPELLELISENQEAFIRMLNEPDGGRSVVGSNEAADRAMFDQPAPTIQVSPQDREAIERLKDLGFPEHLVVQAYFACEKNENLAANFLLSQNLDD